MREYIQICCSYCINNSILLFTIALKNYKVILSDFLIRVIRPNLTMILTITIDRKIPTKTLDTVGFCHRNKDIFTSILCFGINFAKITKISDWFRKNLFIITSNKHLACKKAAKPLNRWVWFGGNMMFAMWRSVVS
jgi:hypothetical protein